MHEGGGAVHVRLDGDDDTVAKRLEVGSDRFPPAYPLRVGKRLWNAGGRRESILSEDRHNLVELRVDALPKEAWGRITEIVLHWKTNDGANAVAPTPAHLTGLDRLPNLVRLSGVPLQLAAVVPDSVRARLVAFGVVADFGGKIFENDRKPEPNLCGASIRACVPAGTEWASAITALGVRGREVCAARLDGISVGLK